MLRPSLSPFPEINIVITSSWREEKDLDELKAYLGDGLEACVIGVTPVIDDPFLHNLRYHEVLSYLKETSQTHLPWFTLDDEKGNYPENSNIILTDRRLGLTIDDKDKIINIINNLHN